MLFLDFFLLSNKFLKIWRNILGLFKVLNRLDEELCGMVLTEFPDDAEHLLTIFLSLSNPTQTTVSPDTPATYLADTFVQNDLPITSVHKFWTIEA